MIGLRQRVALHPGVPSALTASARRREPKETGGLLIGWLDGGAIVVRHILEVHDADATETRWTRREAQANKTLAEFLAKAEHPWLGYVGDWHTHPATIGPSQTDKRSLWKDSRGVRQPLALIVHRSDGTLDILTARRGIALRTSLVTYGDNDQKDTK